VKPFAFDFVFEDPIKGAIVQIWHLPVEAEELTEEQNNKLFEEIEDRKLEYDFGVHDVGYSDELFGFNSYEVKYDKISELLQIWKDILTSLGLETGEWNMVEEEKQE